MFRKIISIFMLLTSIQIHTGDFSQIVPSTKTALAILINSDGSPIILGLEDIMNNPLLDENRMEELNLRLSKIAQMVPNDSRNVLYFSNQYKSIEDVD